MNINPQSPTLKLLQPLDLRWICKIHHHAVLGAFQLKQFLSLEHFLTMTDSMWFHILSSILEKVCKCYFYYFLVRLDKGIEPASVNRESERSGHCAVSTTNTATNCFRLHQSTAASVWWCGLRLVEIAVGLAEDYGLRALPHINHFFAVLPQLLNDRRWQHAASLKWADCFLSSPSCHSSSSLNERQRSF